VSDQFYILAAFSRTLLECETGYEPELFWAFGEEKNPLPLW